MSKKLFEMSNVIMLSTVLVGGFMLCAIKGLAGAITAVIITALFYSMAKMENSKKLNNRSKK